MACYRTSYHSLTHSIASLLDTSHEKILHNSRQKRKVIYIPVLYGHKYKLQEFIIYISSSIVLSIQQVPSLRATRL